MRDLSALSVRALVLASTSALLLAACSQEEAPEQIVLQDNSDPLMSAALADQIMVDPDMINRNGANRAASFGAADGSVPHPDSGSDAVFAAREEAVALVGGRQAMLSAPQPERVEGELPPEAALSVAARAASARAASSVSGADDCAAQAEFSAIWAARMPVSFPVYPRGAVHEAAGTDAGDCHLRVVNFTTPVPLAEVMDFYFTRASRDGFTVQRIVQDGEDILGGTLASAQSETGEEQSFMVFARIQSDGMTSVDLVTTGG